MGATLGTCEYRLESCCFVILGETNSSVVGRSPSSSPLVPSAVVPVSYSVRWTISTRDEYPFSYAAEHVSNLRWSEGGGQLYGSVRDASEQSEIKIIRGRVHSSQRCDGAKVRDVILLVGYEHLKLQALP